MARVASAKDAVSLRLAGASNCEGALWLKWAGPFPAFPSEQPTTPSDPRIAPRVRVEQYRTRSVVATNKQASDLILMFTRPPISDHRGSHSASHRQAPIQVRSCAIEYRRSEQVASFDASFSFHIVFFRVCPRVRIEPGLIRIYLRALFEDSSGT